MIKEKNLTDSELTKFSEYIDYKLSGLVKMKFCECRTEDSEKAVDNYIDALKTIKLDLFLEFKRRVYKNERAS